ncbi:hypothetical protein BOSEA31B_15109 [Hyphomicrobiales bacterium]|nr:hypothetical protein BOSEA31B_15109 [Hyphomicrobiales bacterium]CAH1701601.1 hypothetical protein BOSEA1005_21300 [Hyphomicrobiales bacterium]CAI0345768.1 hypothetical protein BO1005MUT1_440007 [Hyphomicrobiales bacterium]
MAGPGRSETKTAAAGGTKDVKAMGFAQKQQLFRPSICAARSPLVAGVVPQISDSGVPR